MRDTLHGMKLTEEDLRVFQEIWKNTFHEAICIEEARLIAADVMELYSLLEEPRHPELQPEADNRKQTNEVFSLLQKIE